MSNAISKLRVLVVDDDPSMRSALRRTLAETCDVTLADGPAQAIMMLQAGRRFDLILSDFQMPGMNGVEFLARAAVYSTALLVLMSGGDDQATARTEFEEQAQGTAPLIDGFLEKPWDPEALQAVLAQARGRLAAAQGTPEE